MKISPWNLKKSPWTFPDIGESKNVEKLLPGENPVNTGFLQGKFAKNKKIEIF